MRVLDRRRGPNPPKLVVIDPRAHRDGRRRPTSTSPRGSARTSPLLNGLLHLIIDGGHDRPRRSSTRTPSASSSWQTTVADYPPERVEADHRRAGGAAPRQAAEILGTAPTLRLDCPPGRLPVEPGDRRGLPGQQPQPDPRPDRQARLRHPPDERPADRRRTPARCGADGDCPASATGTTRSTSTSWPGSGTSTRTSSRTGRRRPTRCRSSAMPRPARSSMLWIIAHQPGRLAARAAPHPRASSAATGPLRGRAGRLPDRDGASSPTWSCRRRSGARRPACFTNADRTVHISPQGGRAARRGAVGPRHLPRLRPPHGLPRQGRRAADQVDDAGGALRGLEGVHARAGPATTPA